ncbi:hypothetical protein M23134_04937 [Microscilla marina ATCC 23134]|uniref:Uncharacterized protein n=1 Tax=Microscilla marina ATCC 23134 TaxID=313606 RepID=A2A051_MICM2|nr:hypothetical protein M23134_04937 [Microscilla marina ATCC 23134]
MFYLANSTRATAIATKLLGRFEQCQPSKQQVNNCVGLIVYCNKSNQTYKYYD